VRVPIIGDFHYNGHLLLKKYPECARALAKYRINPGNVNIGRKHDDNFRTMIEAAIEYNKPVRIGVNWGSLDQALLTRMMDENNRAGGTEGRPRRDAGRDRGERARIGARPPSAMGCQSDKIILSAKVSGVQDLIDVTARWRRLRLRAASGFDGSGLGSKGVVASTAALAIAAAGRASAIPFAPR
jgi:(E)-4-hydroxy-3-methylbut-2-enyl-diphosphate synthase